MGDAVISSLAAISSSASDADGERIPGAIVLLSDGETTVGRSVEAAIPEAVEAGVAVSTIAYGTAGGSITITDPDTGFPARVGVPVNGQSLDLLAAETGGQSFNASTAEGLVDVFDEIGSFIGYDLEFEDVTWRWVAVAMAILAGVSMVSVLWYQRLP